MKNQTVSFVTIAAAVVFAGCSTAKTTATAVQQEVPGVKIVGDRVEFDEHILFASGKADIDSRSYELLDRIAMVLSYDATVAAVHVEGHTDATGDPAFNEQLSHDRAAAVAEYLRGKGVSTPLVSKGFGQSQPLCAEQTSTCHAKNRRVEFLLRRS